MTDTSSSSGRSPRQVRAEQTYARLFGPRDQNAPNATYGVKDVFSVGMSAKYGSTWTSSKEETLTHTVTVPAHTFYQKVAISQREKVTGDFTIRLGKTTWIPKDVSFETPVADQLIGYKELPRPLTDAERAELPIETTIKPLT